MNAEIIAAAIFIVGAIFAAGQIRKEILQAKLDVNRVGAKLRELEKATDRRHHNLCMVVIAMQDSEADRFKIAGMLKED